MGIEVAIEDAKQVFGARQARNRTTRAVERPSRLLCLPGDGHLWYATAGHDPADVEITGPARPGMPAKPSPRPPTWPPSSGVS